MECSGFDGIPPELLELYQKYEAEENRAGQKRVLLRYRQILKEHYQEKRSQLACLDYLIAELERKESL